MNVKHTLNLFSSWGPSINHVETERERQQLHMKGKEIMSSSNLNVSTFTWTMSLKSILEQPHGMKIRILRFEKYALLMMRKLQSKFLIG